MMLQVRTRKLYNTFPVLVLSLVLAGYLFAGCGSDGNGFDPPPLQGDVERIVDSGSRPLWAPDGVHLFYALDPTEREDNQPGIGLVTTDVAGSEKVVLLAPHNYDFTLSPDGSRLAFSQQGDEPGVYVVAIEYSEVPFTPTPELVYPNGRRPSWLYNSEELLVEDGNGAVQRVNWSTGASELVLDNALHPLAAPTSDQFAYYRMITSGTPAYRLNYMILGQPQNVYTLARLAGLDAVWAEDNATLYLSQSTDAGTVNIVRAHTSVSDAAQFLVGEATSPTLVADGRYMLATSLNGDATDGILLYDTQNDSRRTLVNFGYQPAGHPTEERGAFAAEDGIYLLTW